jgi:AcrR family transcriptional regulator
MVPASTPTERPLRRDAERNRQLIIDAARVVFAERGLGASHDEIAQQAGVGVGTVYRRFPDKEQLIDALFEDALQEIYALAQESLANPDPWDGFVQFMVRGQELQCADRGLKELVLGSDRGADHVARARARIFPTVELLLTRAQEAGVVRDDIVASDLPLMQSALGAIVDSTRDIAPDTWRRTLTVLLDGLRPARRTTRPLTAPPLTLEQLEASMQNVPARPRPH